MCVNSGADASNGQGHGISAATNPVSKKPFQATPFGANPFQATPFRATPFRATPFRATPFRMTRGVVLHARARGVHPQYPMRFKVPVSLTPWRTAFRDYKPVDFTHEVVRKNPPWADNVKVDKETVKTRVTWSCGRFNRSLKAAKLIAKNGRPRNPVGRTGMIGRGLLGKWGPNYAADPIVTRYDPMRAAQLQVVTVVRRDTGENALPGGMVNPCQTVPQTLKAEFKEEALRQLEGNALMTADIEARVDKLFHGGRDIYKGYVDDPRNTDNAWMETRAVHFHIKSDDPLVSMPLAAGDDACAVEWTDVTGDMKLYASHAEWMRFVKTGMERRASLRV